jgi:hypothetical protein
MIESEIRILAKKMARCVDELHPDASLVFLSSWKKPQDSGNHVLVHGDEGLAHRSFREMEPIMRRLESLNLNPSDKSISEIHRITTELCESEDPEMDRLFRKVLSLFGSPIDGETILMVSWMELGIYHHLYVDLGGMIRGIVGLFNAGIDAFRDLSRMGEPHDE